MVLVERKCRKVSVRKLAYYNLHQYIKYPILTEELLVNPVCKAGLNPVCERGSGFGRYDDGVRTKLPGPEIQVIRVIHV